MKMKRLPQIILLDGTTGVGKSSLLAHLREEYKTSVLVGAKLTTRQKRISDNDWEFGFVERIPDQYARYSFKSVGNHYAIDQNELTYAIGCGLVYAISCVDQRVMEILTSNFDVVVIYVYRSWTMTDFEALLTSRGTSDRFDAQFRRDEIASIAPQYFEKIELYDHVLLNVGSESDVIEQFSKILLSYGIARDSETDKAR